MRTEDITAARDRLRKAMDDSRLTDREIAQKAGLTPSKLSTALSDKYNCKGLELHLDAICRAIHADPCLIRYGDAATRRISEEWLRGKPGATPEEASLLQRYAHGATSFLARMMQPVMDSADWMRAAAMTSYLRSHPWTIAGSVGRGPDGTFGTWNRTAFAPVFNPLFEGDKHLRFVAVVIQDSSGNPKAQCGDIAIVKTLAEDPTGWLTNYQHGFVAYELADASSSGLARCEISADHQVTLKRGDGEVIACDHRAVHLRQVFAIVRSEDAQMPTDDLLIPTVGRAAAAIGSHVDGVTDDEPPVRIRDRWRAVKIHGDSGYPVVLDGQTVLVDPALPCERNRIVVVHTDDGPQLKRIGDQLDDGRVMLASLNAGRDPKLVRFSDYARQPEVVVAVVFTDSVAK